MRHVDILEIDTKMEKDFSFGLNLKASILTFYIQRVENIVQQITSI